MIKRERAARIAAQVQVAELQKQLAEERAKNAAIREEQRRQAAEERRQEHQAFMAALTELTAEIAHLRQQRNGDGHNGQ